MKFRCAQITLMPEYATVVGNMYTADNTSLPQYSCTFAMTGAEATAEFTPGAEYDVVFTAVVTPPVE